MRLAYQLKAHEADNRKLLNGGAPNAPPLSTISFISQLELSNSAVRCSLYETHIDIWIKNRKRAEFDHRYVFRKFWKYWVKC